MKIALIGLGDIAQKAYLPILNRFPQVEWVFCSRHRAHLEVLASQYRIDELTDDYKSLCQFGIDGVMIHSATSSHFEIAAFFLQKGIPVFVDKPLCDNFQDVERLYEIAEQHRQPLFVGFNRRYLPLLNTHLNGLKPVDEIGNPILSLRWEKHRHSLPGQLRTFVFDDFIHPLDSINLNGDMKPEEIIVLSQTEDGQLCRLDVIWKRDNTIFEASMNRQYGQTKEVISAAYRNEAYVFDGFLEGTRLQDNQSSRLQLKDWTGMQASKGFEAMLGDWLKVVDAGTLSDQTRRRNLNSHQIAEMIVRQVAAEHGLSSR